jgi:hypothetical protein
MSPSTSRRLILRLAYARCAHEAASGPCGPCFRTEVERHVARTHPGLLHEDVVQRVDRWMLAVGPKQGDVSLAS